MKPDDRPVGDGACGADGEQAAQATPRRRAAALHYEPESHDAQHGPRVVAKGERLLADEIIARARAAGVPVHESKELVALLMQVDLDAHIPPALYIAVAEVLAWAYRLEHEPTVLADEASAAKTSKASMQRE